MRKIQEGASALEQDLADVKTATQGAGRAQYELATQGMGGSELAAYDYNAALEGQIQVLLDAANGTSNASENMKKLANDAANLAIDLKRASGDIAGANRDQAMIDTRGYTSEEIAVYNDNQRKRDEIREDQQGQAQRCSDGSHCGSPPTGTTINFAGLAPGPGFCSRSLPDNSASTRLMTRQK